MKIAFEASSVISDKPTGIARYIKNLIKSIANINIEHSLKILYKASRLKYKNNWYRPEAIPIQVYQGSIWPLTKHVDIVHGLDTIVPNWKKSKKIITIHDLFPLLEEDDSISPEAFRKKKRIKYREAVSISDLIITVSENTRTDVINYFQVSKSKVVSIYPGVHSSYFYQRSANEVASVRRKYNITNNYLLFVGAISGRKNTERLVLAYSLSKAKDQYDLILAGSVSYLGERTIEAIKRNNLSNKIKLLKYVVEEDLAALYTGASGFVFPTLYEGFGFPILEAMLCQVPVLTSNTGSAPEVGKNFTLFVDPYSIESITNGIDTLVDGKKFDVLSAREYANQFSWDNCANKMMGIYKAITA